MENDSARLKPVVILDFGSQYTQLIARRIRSLGVYSIILPCWKSADEVLAHTPGALIFSGGPASIYEKGSPKADAKLFAAGLPILGICYGMQVLTWFSKGDFKASGRREYGHTPIEIQSDSLLFKGLPRKLNVWMSHGDRIDRMPEGYQSAAKSEDALAAFENVSAKRWGLQFHPEVVHSEHGTAILSNFIFEICKLEKNWSLPSFIETQVKLIRERVGKKHVVLGLSGGVDSSVLAVLLHKAIGDQLTCVFVNNAVLRENEAEKVVETFRNHFKMNLRYIDATGKFMKALKGVDEPEKKRRIIGKIFVKVFFSALKGFDFLAQGTLYPDVIESVSTRGPSDTIKTHHNRVKQILDLQKKGRLIEPFEELFKDEVREIGREMGVPDEIIRRHPFPGPGLAIRIIGALTEKRLNILRKADAIVLDEVKKAGLYDKYWQCFAVLLPVKTVGVMGDQRTYGQVVALRIVESVDGMTADFALPPKELLTRITSRIVGEIREVNRVVLDITSKPPGTIEWE